MASEQHRLSDIDAETATGHCSACERVVDLYFHPTPQRWECRQRRRERKRGQWARYAAKPRVKAARMQSRRGQTLRTYGLTPDEWAAMAEAQQGRCAICRQEVPLVTDHNHADGQLRDLLCVACNRGLGFMQESEEILTEAIAYLRRHRLRSA